MGKSSVAATQFYNLKTLNWDVVESLEDFFSLLLYLFRKISTSSHKLLPLSGTCLILLT